jgi:cytoskeletal protein RodZ
MQMAYEEQEARKSRVVVDTPTSRREMTQTEAARYPERSGISGTTVGVIVVLAVALITILVLFLLSGQTTTNNNPDLAAQQPAPVPQTTIIQQPAPQQQPPVIIQQPAPVTQPAPIIVAPSAPSGGTASSGTDDTSIQTEIDKRIADDPTLSTWGIIATVLNGKVTLLGTVKTEAQKAQVEKTIHRVKGVKEIDNQLTVSG